MNLNCFLLKTYYFLLIIFYSLQQSFGFYLENRQLHIYEEETNLFWAPVVIVATATATYLLSRVFLSDITAFWGVTQIVAILLILLSFYGIMKISEPLYHFSFRLKDSNLIIQAKKGELYIKTINIALQDIEAMKFSSSEPRSPGEALFDFSITYHLMWKPKQGNNYQRLLDLDSASFVLKVDDIAKIIRFIRTHNSGIYVPPEQASFFNL